MNKDKLKEIIKNSNLPDKGKSELNELVNEKKAKAKIDYKTLTELEIHKEEVIRFFKKLKEGGLNFRYELKGKSFIVYLLYQEFEIKERIPIKSEKPPEKTVSNPKAVFKKEYLRIKNQLSKIENKPAFKIFGDYFKFYDHLRVNFIDKLIEFHPDDEEFRKILDIVLKQALEFSSKEKIEELYKGSLLQFKAKIDEMFRDKIFKSGKEELFFRLDYRKNDFLTEDAKKTADLFEDKFINAIKDIYGNQEDLLLLILEAVDKISDSKSPKEAKQYLVEIFPKIILENKNMPKALQRIKNKIETL